MQENLQNMKGNNMKKTQKEQDMLEEYDFSNGIQGNIQKDMKKEQML